MTTAVPRRVAHRAARPPPAARSTAEARVLEIASGSGEHAAYFATMMPSVLWQPTDPDPEKLASIAAHRAAAEAPNLLAPLHLDVMSPTWPVARADAVVCINMIHIAP